MPYRILTLKPNEPIADGNCDTHNIISTSDTDGSIACTIKFEDGGDDEAPQSGDVQGVAEAGVAAEAVVKGVDDVGVEGEEQE